MLPKVFDMFTQVDRTRRRAQGGLGIGLTLVRTLVEAHGGTVEVRSEGDYGPKAERQMAQKRDDYFRSGTLVVWDVDCEADTIHVYRANNPARPTTFGRGQMADALPVLPGWSVSVDWVFDAHK